MFSFVTGMLCLEHGVELETCFMQALMIRAVDMNRLLFDLTTGLYVPVDKIAPLASTDGATNNQHN
jgi:hypothetical protein